MPYDDSQPRANDGKWTSGGSSGGGLPPSAYAAGMAKAPSKITAAHQDVIDKMVTVGNMGVFPMNQLSAVARKFGVQPIDVEPLQRGFKYIGVKISGKVYYARGMSGPSNPPRPAGRTGFLPASIASRMR